jgi:hypothetical protein
VDRDLPGQGFPDSRDEAQFFNRDLVKIKRNAEDEEFSSFHPAPFDPDVRGRPLFDMNQISRFKGLAQGLCLKKRGLPESSCLLNSLLDRGRTPEEVNSGAEDFTRDFDNDLIGRLGGRGGGRMMKPEIGNGQEDQGQNKEDAVLRKGKRLPWGHRSPSPVRRPSLHSFAWQNIAAMDGGAPLDLDEGKD